MKNITYILLLFSLSLFGQRPNNFNDSTNFARPVRFAVPPYIIQGAGNGKVLTSDANGRATWQTFSSSGVTQQALNDSIARLDSTINAIPTPLLTLTDDTLTISGGNSVILPVYIQIDSATITSYDVLNSQNAPPGSPATGDTYLVGTSPSGAWVGHAKDIAEWNGSAWDFTDGVQGDFLYNATTALTYIFRSGNWVQTTGIPALHNGNNISSGLKIGTNNARSLTFETNNVNRGRIDSLGRYYIYDTSLRYSNKYIQVDSLTGRLIATEIPYNDGFIPLSGTEVGKPVTGTVVTQSDYNTIVSTQNAMNIGIGDDLNLVDNANQKSQVVFGKDSELMAFSAIEAVFDNNTGRSATLQLISDTSTANLILNIGSGVSDSRGFIGSRDFSPNITDLDYTQKIYVDNAISSNRKVDTSYIFRNATLDSTCMITVINGNSYRSCAKDSLPTVSSTSTTTFTNKRITARVDSTTSSATPTINTDNVDTYKLTAQAADITSFTTNLSGTPTDDQILHIVIIGTSTRLITWGSKFESSTVALPTTTSGTTRLDVYFIWNTATSKWRCGGVW